MLSRLKFLIAALLFASIYWAVPSFDYVWDDVSGLVFNPAYQGPLSEGMGVSQNSFVNPELKNTVALQTTHDSVRPLLFLQFWIEHKFADWDSTLSHLINLLLALCFIGLSYWILRRLGASETLSAIFLILMSCHPLLIEPFAYVSARSDIYSAILGLLSAYSFYLYLKNRSFKFLLASCASYLLALGFKENLILLPLLLALIFGTQLTKREFALCCLSFSLCLVAYLAWRTQVATTARSNLIQESLLYMPNYWLQYLIQFFIPYEISTERPPLQLNPYLGWLLFALGGIFCVMKKYWKAFALLGSSFLLLWPSIIGIDIFQASADRYFIVQVMLLCVGLSFLIEKLSAQKRYLAIGLTAGLVILWTTISLQSVKVWENNILLYQHAVKKSGTSMSFFRLSTAVSQENALPLLEKAIEVDPKNIRALNNLGALYLLHGRYDEAEVVLIRSQQNPNFTLPSSWLNLGLVYIQKGKQKEGCAQIREAIHLAPNYVPAKNELKARCSEEH